MSTQLTLPTITLPARTTPHLRALIYASSPGGLITPLSLSPPPSQTITVSAHPPTVPLHHPPAPTQRPPQIFLSCFPLSARLDADHITFTTHLPSLTHSLSPPAALPPSALADTPDATLLRTAATPQTHGLLTLSGGRFEPLRRPRGDPAGAWATGGEVFDTAALLLLARHVYRRCNRRIGTRGSVRKHVVLLRFCDDGVLVRRGWITVDRMRPWVCRVPLRGGSGRFRMCADGTKLVGEGVRAEGVVRSGRGDDVRDGRRDETEERVESEEEEEDGGLEEEEEEEFMVAKMREFSFGEVGDGEVEDSQDGARLSAEVRVPQVDLDAENDACTESSDDEKEDAMLEALCEHYLRHGWEESVRRELARLDTNT